MFNKVVLAIDDDIDMLTLINTMLKFEGYAVLKASSVASALHLIESFSPNLFIVDVLMPDMDGFELCERIRRMPHTANVPIIILTALNTTKNRQRAIDVGANAFIPKDNLASDLSSEIHRLLRSGVSTTAADREI